MRFDRSPSIGGERPSGRRDAFQKCISHSYAHNRPGGRNAIRGRDGGERERDRFATAIASVRAYICIDRLIGRDQSVGRSAMSSGVAVIPASRVSIGQFTARYRITKQRETEKGYRNKRDTLLLSQGRSLLSRSHGSKSIARPRP